MAGRVGRTAYGTALGRLRAAQKPAKGVSLYSRYVNRPLGRLLAAGGYVLGLRPHHVTAVSALASFAALAAVAWTPPSWPLGVAVCAGLVLGFALDSADGQLARLRGESSPAGEWLDHVVDCVKITGLHAAVLISFHRFFDLPSAGWLLVPLAFQLAAVVLFFGGLLTDKLRTAPAAPAPAGPTPAAPAPARASRLRAAALLPVDYGVLCAVFLLLGDERAFRVGYAALAVAYVGYCAAFLVKWYRELPGPVAPGRA